MCNVLIFQPMTQYEKDRLKAQEWAEKCWPMDGELSRRVHHDLMRQAFMQGYERRLQEERRRALDKRDGSWQSRNFQPQTSNDEHQGQ